MFNNVKSLRLPLFACAMIGIAPISSACEIPEGWQKMTSETNADAKAAIRIPPDTVLLGQPFDVEFLTCNDSSISIENITVEATMPAHNHGMNYSPKITAAGDHKYRAAGMLFHMPGQWHISLETRDSNKTDRFGLEISVK